MIKSKKQRDVYKALPYLVIGILIVMLIEFFISRAGYR